MRIHYYSERSPSSAAVALIKRAKFAVYGEEVVEFERVAMPGPGVISFTDEDGVPGVKAPSFNSLLAYPFGEAFIVAAFLILNNDGVVPYSPPIESDRVLFFDIESHSVDDRWNMKPRDYFRLGQYAWNDGEVVLTEDFDEVVDALRQAEIVVGHNIINFDLPALVREEVTEFTTFDTFIHATLAVPAPDEYIARSGRKYVKANNPKNASETAHGWFSLDNLAFQFGVPGKIMPLQDLANEYGGFGKIDVNDPRFRDYSRQDVVSVRDVSSVLSIIEPLTGYAVREQKVAQATARMMVHGFRVDVPVATKRRDELNDRKMDLLRDLNERYGFPTEGTQPWRSNRGKQAILDILKDNGIVPSEDPNWPRTKKTGNISLGGDAIVDGTEGTEAESLGTSLAELMGQRPLSQQALDYTQDDGYVHPEFLPLQRSRRWSVVKPGLTTWSSKNPEKAVEKSYFIASEGHKLVEFDFSNADARIVAAYSGDELYAERFQPGVDGHQISGYLAFGEEVYESNAAFYRDKSKPLTHGWAYGGQAGTLSANTGLPFEVCKRFVEGMSEMYKDVAEWQSRVRSEGRSGWITNDWGAVLPVPPERAFTVAPALYGQSGTRELIADALLNLGKYLDYAVLIVHDAMVFDIPEEELETAVPAIKALMECTWQPSDGSGQAIEFPVGYGSPESDWMEASHG